VTDIDNLLTVTAAHSTALADLGSELNTLSHAFRQFRGETAHVSSDLHTLSDQFLQFTSSYRASDQAHQDTSVRLALQMESNARTQSDTRDELRATLQLFATGIDSKMDEMRSILTSANTTNPLATSHDARRNADEPEALGPPASFPPAVVGAGADRFTLPPFGRGRALGVSRPDRLRHPETADKRQPHPALLDTASRPQTTHVIPQPTQDGTPRRHTRDDAHHRSLGESPPHPHDKRHAAYCRAIDVSRVEDSKLYALLTIVDVDGNTTAFVSEQFRIWTLSRPQTTSITIETAVWSLFRINHRDALLAFADFETHFDDFPFRLQHGEDTDDSLDGILRVTLPHTHGFDADRTINNVVETLAYHNIDDRVRDVTTSHVASCSAVKAAGLAHLAPLPSPTRARERNIIRTTLMHALMMLPYSEDASHTHHGDHGPDTRVRRDRVRACAAPR
jgi:hypothetical protein